jgi:hypothetical protein
MRYKVSITIDHTKVGASDSTNFPMLISGTYAGGGGPDLRSVSNGGNVQSASGYDIYFYSDATLTTRLCAERVAWNAATGQIEAWVKVPTVSHTADSVIYAAYGDAGVAADPNSDATFGSAKVCSSFNAVYHFGDGTTLSLADSTANARTGTNHSATAGAGKVGGGAALVSASSEYIQAAASSLFNSAKKVSGWVKSTGSNMEIAFVNDGTGGNNGFEMEINPAGKLVANAFIGGNWRTITSTATVNDGAWHHVAVTVSGATLAIYVDGAATTSTYTGSLTMVASPTLLMGKHPSANLYLNGSLDEIQVDSVARSADWITAEYNNQNSPSTFYTMGSEVALLVLSASIQASFELLQGSNQTSIFPWELSKTFIQTVQVSFEALAGLNQTYLSQTSLISFETGISLSVLEQVPFDSLMESIITKQFPLESLIGLIQTDTTPLEWISTLSLINTMSLESLLEIAKAEQIPFEWLREIDVLSILPIEWNETPFPIIFTLVSGRRLSNRINATAGDLVVDAKVARNRLRARDNN